MRMADGPISNLPPGMDAYAGYVNLSGIGITYPMVVAKFPNAQHLSITTNGSAAMCADVESGAMSQWTGYDYGYCAVSNVNALVTAYGRPRKLWTAHYDPKFGAHICSPACWPGLVTTADGTQWTDHGNADWDESLLSDTFFDPPQPTPDQAQGDTMTSWQEGGQNHLAGVIPGVGAFHWWQAIGGNPAGQPEWWCQKLTETPVVP